MFQTFSQKLQKQFSLHSPTSFFQFLGEGLVNLQRGVLQNLRKVDVVKYRRELSEITRRRTSQHKRRSILSSSKHLEGFHGMDQFVLTPYSIYQSQITLPKNRKLEKASREEIVPKDFDSFYSAINARLKTSNNQHLIDSVLDSRRIKLRQSENMILDNRDTKEPIVDFLCALKRKKKLTFQTGICRESHSINKTHKLPLHRRS